HNRFDAHALLMPNCASPVTLCQIAMSLYSIETYGELQPHLRHEWLLTNGLGSFASGTFIGCNTRRYHGLLCAATTPPVGRVMTLNRVAEIIRLDGKSDMLEL